ncbi:glycoside hydrolase family 127 protein [Tropicimonas sp. IMCC34043]|uniref:glycoside hydrolase family 127 protein n=1 Tax=Tropicimonas sp. IMCC34043 TaxID=2248760 RepID=UPI000E23E259|nr:beta-L-arabinofuranosidase domain-containing protein [Tropicimonas sp. IMCC34043]
MNEPFDPRAAGKTRSRFRPLSVDKIEVGGFFGPRLDTISTTTAKMLFDRCIEAGMLDQVDPDRPNPGIVIPYQDDNPHVTTQMFWDSDFGKSIETAAYALNRTPDAELEARVDEVIDAYGRLQQEDGYLNSWFIRIEPGKRWTNLRDQHELYNAGHLIEGAVAYFHATGKRRFLDILCRYADCIAKVFGPGEGQKHGYPGHPELELALVKLGRATGAQRYLDLARFLVDERGQPPLYFDLEARARGETPEDFHFRTLEYCQAHRPVREQDAVVGHAVRAAYLYAGMADVATEFADTTLDAPLERLWSHLTEKNLYVTGGFGPSALNEGLTFDYDLPNETAYAETCAAVALVFWASRMLGRRPDARYGDIMEQALYNGALSGLSFDGETFFYDNPLESRGDHHRWVWHRCPCCPPNISRLVASIGTYFYGVADTEIAVHLYNAGTAEIDVAGGHVTLTQETRYPLDGAVAITLRTASEVEFALSLRVPGWADGATLRLNGETEIAEVRDGYLRISRRWRSGDRVELSFDMAPRRVFAHPKVSPDQGRTALMRGPLVYCLEGVDNGSDLNSVVLGDDVTLEAAEEDILGGIVRLTARAQREVWPGNALYRTAPPSREATVLSAVPYYAWDNRAPGEMLVWVRREAGQ